MFSDIKVLHDDGKITDEASYSIPPDKALICYLEQTINKNFNTWQYGESTFLREIKLSKSKRGYLYTVPNTNTCIAAYLRNEEDTL